MKKCQCGKIAKRVWCSERCRREHGWKIRETVRAGTQDAGHGMSRADRTMLGIELFRRHALVGVEYTYDELAGWYGMTEAGVRCIVEKALRKVRRQLNGELILEWKGGK